MQSTTTISTMEANSIRETPRAGLTFGGVSFSWTRFPPPTWMDLWFSRESKNRSPDSISVGAMFSLNVGAIDSLASLLPDHTIGRSSGIHIPATITLCNATRYGGSRGPLLGVNRNVIGRPVDKLPTELVESEQRHPSSPSVQRSAQRYRFCLGKQVSAPFAEQFGFASPRSGVHIGNVCRWHTCSPFNGSRTCRSWGVQGSKRSERLCGERIGLCERPRRAKSARPLQCEV